MEEESQNGTSTVNSCIMEVNGTASHILYIGCSVTSEGFNTVSRSSCGLMDKVIVVIPGNPGCADFYRSFVESLHEKSDCNVFNYYLKNCMIDNVIFLLRLRLARFIESKIFFPGKELKQKRLVISSDM